MAKNTTSSVEATTEGKERVRTPQLMAKSGKPARGLHWPITAAQKKTLAAFNLSMACAVEGGRAQLRVSKGQFAKPHFYYLYMAAKAEHIAKEYGKVAADAEANPEKYKGNRVNLQQRLADAESALVAAFAAKLGITVEEAQAMVADVN